MSLSLAIMMMPMMIDTDDDLNRETCNFGNVRQPDRKFKFAFRSRTKLAATENTSSHI